MTKKILIITAFILIFTLAATGCGRKKESDNTPAATYEDDTDGLPLRETLVYYQDDVGYLVPVMRKIPWEEGIAKATIRMMMDTPEQQEDLMAMGLRALLPADAKILGMTISDNGVARVDFNSAAAEFDSAIEESNMVQGLVLTLVEFSTIDKVQFLFDGHVRDKLKFGAKVGEPLGKQDINLEMSVDGNKSGAKVTVFFQSTSPSEYDYLVPVTRIVSSETATLETAISELLKGPKELSNVYTDIPQGTKLLGVQMEGGVTYINFSKEFSALGNSKKSEELVLRSIILTARQFSDIDAVKILVDGDEYKPGNTGSIAVFANEF